MLFYLHCLLLTGLKEWSCTAVEASGEAKSRILPKAAHADGSQISSPAKDPCMSSAASQYTQIMEQGRIEGGGRE